MINLISIYGGGSLTLLMALFHLRFPKLFHWKNDYTSISEVNKKIFFTIHLALLFMFIVIGILSLVYARELSECTGISFGFNVAISVFWLWRVVWQIFYFKGKTIHYILIAVFLILSATYSVPVVFKLI